ncbi:MAG: type II secretion system protein GspC [Aquificae bacterium]|nr:type II secretion system protein GspC [Aquificota bacterium]
MRVLTYALGLSYVLSTAVGGLTLYLALKEALSVNYAPRTTESGREVTAEELRRLAGRFFGPAPVRRAEQAPPLRQFRLVGTMLSDELKGVFVELGKKVYFVEEGKSFQGYRLARVEPYGAYFERSGRLYELKLERGKKDGGSAKTGREVRISRRELLALTADPAKMFTQIRLVPFVRNGRTEGFIFEWVKPGSLFDRMGIRPGDVLLSINNATIRSGEDAFRLLQVLRNEPNLKVVLLRNGRKEVINVRIE